MRQPKILTTLKTYSWPLFLSDLIAGATVATVALPLSLAIAIASGADPAAGLVTAIVAGFLISLLGGIVQARKFNPAEFAWQFARMMGADCFLFQAPAVVDSPATREALIERCGLRDLFRRAERLDVALLSVGTMAASSTAFRFNLISDEERMEMVRMGAVGDLLFNFFDRDGRLLDHPVNKRIMALPIEQLRGVPTRIIASGGNEKVECLLGAIKLIDCNVLITNEATAREMLIRKS